MVIPNKYLEILGTSGRSLQEIGVSGVALTRQYALDAVASLKGTQVAMLGGDLLRLVDGKLRYTRENWYTQRLSSEDIATYVSRSHEKAEEFIRGYQDPEDGSVFYALVTSELGDSGTRS